MNYVIENGLDFYTELKTTESDYSDNNCKLSYQVLDNNHIKLECGHKFNYIPLYNEVIQQKKYSALEINRLRTHQIKCPYCRVKMNALLPFIPLENGEKIRGVNFPKKYCMSMYSCSYIYIKGKKKGNACNKDATNHKIGAYCDAHLKIIKNQEKKKKKKQTQKKPEPETTKCLAIIQNGPRKGQECGCKIKVQNTTMCKRHSPKISP